jgi:hypothetical protein
MNAMLRARAESYLGLIKTQSAHFAQAAAMTYI